MKVLLTTLNSKYVHSNLAIRYLYASYQAHLAEIRTITGDEYRGASGVAVELREFTINNDGDYIFTEMVRANYDVVCFSCYVWNIEQIKALGESLRKACPHTVICVGGPEVSFDGDDFLRKNSWADVVFCGEGEESFAEFCDRLSGSGGMPLREKLPALLRNSVRGLVLRAGGGQIVSTGTRPLQDFDSVVFPYDFSDLEKENAKTRVIYYESTRGCPFGCTYCLSSVDRSVRARGLERVKRELDFFIRNDVMQVKFVDRTFNYDRKRAYEIIKYLIENDNGVTNFHLEICAELLDDDTLELLKTSRKGQFQMEIGIQSLKDETLKEINRPADLQKLFERIRALIEPGNIHIHVDLIAGLPLEDFESFKKSFDGVYGLGADALQLGFLKVLKGTPLWGQAEEHGLVYRQRAPYEVVSTKYISALELVELKQVENVLDIYYNRGGFEKSVAYLMNLAGEGAFGFFSRLARFYYGCGFQHRERKKEDQYLILMEFGERLAEDISAEICAESEGVKSVRAHGGEAGDTERVCLTGKVCDSAEAGESEKADNLTEAGEPSKADEPAKACDVSTLKKRIFDIIVEDASNYMNPEIFKRFMRKEFGI